MLRCSNVGTLQTGVAARQGNLAMRRMVSTSAATGRGYALRGLSSVITNGGASRSAQKTPGSAPVAGLGSGSRDLRGGASLFAFRVRTYSTADITSADTGATAGDNDQNMRPQYKESLLDIAREGTSPRQRALIEQQLRRQERDVFYLYKQASGIPIMGKEPPKEPTRSKPRVPREEKLESDESTHNEPIPDPDAEFIPFEDNKVKLYRPPPTEESASEPEEEETFEGLFDPVVLEDLPERELKEGERAVAKEALVEAQESLAKESPIITAESSQEDGSQLAEASADESLKTSEAEPQHTESESTVEEEAHAEDESTPARIKKQRVEAKPLVTPIYLNPTNTTLSNVLEACLLMNQGTSNGRAYWQLFTQHYCGPRLRPNSDTSHRYLRLLRKSHSSRLVTQVLKYQMAPAGLLEGKTFSIAISCCRRDRNNPNVLENAAEILQLMEEAAALPYTRPLETYISLIQSFEKNPQRLTTLNGFDIGKSKNKNMKQVGKDLLGNLWLGAVNALRPHIARLHEALQQKDPTPYHTLRPKQQEIAVSSLEAWRCMVKTRAILDSLLDKDQKCMVSTEDRKELKKESEMLKPYSDAMAVKKFGNTKGATLPTRGQHNELERRKEQAANDRAKDKDIDADADEA